MTREEYNNLTDEQRYEYIKKLEEEKLISDKSLERVLTCYNKDDDQFIQLTDEIDFDLMLRVSDIIKARKTVGNKTIITTREIEEFYGKKRNKTYTVKGTIDDIMQKINLLKDKNRNNVS